MAMAKSGFLRLLLASAAYALFSERDTLGSLSGPPGPACAKASFANPGWEVQNFTYIPPDEAVNDTTPFLTFILSNTAQGSWVLCDASRRDVDFAGRNKMEWLNCHMPQTFFQFDGGTGTLMVRQTWGCSDLKPHNRMSWVGNGTATMPGYEQPTAHTPYTASSVTITASLLEPIEISPVQPKSPPSTGSTDCSEVSTSPSWIISAFSFNRTYHTYGPDFYNHYNDLSLTVKNTASNREFNCSILVRDLTGIGSTTEDWYACERYTKTDLSIAYDLDYNWIGIKESWSCGDAKASNASITAEGYKQLSLDCTEPKYLSPIPYGTDITYNISTYSCTLPSDQPTTITGYPEPVPDFPHSNYNNSCTASSFNLTSLSLTHFVHKSMWALEQLGSPEVLTHNLLIQLENPATGDNYRLTGSWWDDEESNETQTVWRQCNAALPRPVLSCDYKFDNATNELGVRVQWFCDELDPEHGITFTAEASAELPTLECVDNPEPGTEVGQPGLVRDGDVICYLGNATSPVKLGITDFKWNSTGERIDIGPVFPWYN